MPQGKKCVIFTVVWLWLMCGTGFGEDENTYMARPIRWNSDKTMSVALNWDYQHYTDTDFFDFWGVDSDPSSTLLPSSVGYEIRFWENIGLEFVLGYTDIDESGGNRLEDDDSVSIDMQTYYLLFSVKRYFPLTNSLFLFGGIGLDIHFIDGEIAYTNEDESYRLDYSQTLFGGHACLGAEYFIVKKKFPVSVGLQYKYTLLQGEEVDEDLISAVNDDTESSYSSKELNLSGHTLSLSLKIHF
ncbi:outer membrane beta-barrel protein [Desulfosarcina ovata]|nr:outer membrane beta-barrel protein [Desulfosarcina ovata]